MGHRPGIARPGSTLPLAPWNLTETSRRSAGACASRTTSSAKRLYEPTSRCEELADETIASRIQELIWVS